MPRDIKEAVAILKWRLAVQEEKRILEKYSKWEIMELPSRKKKKVECKWVCTVKFDAHGSIDQYKSSLVVKGFTQRYGLDQKETFAL